MLYRPRLSKAGNYIHGATEIILSLPTQKTKETQNPMTEACSISKQK